MTRRRATIWFVMMFLIAISSPPVRAQRDKYSNPTLEGITAISVTIEALPDVAKEIGLTREAIQTDVELKLRLAGMRVVTREEVSKLPGAPHLYVQANLTGNADAADIEFEARQNVLLERNGKPAISAVTWRTSVLLSHPSLQEIRTYIKDGVDEFLNAWLSVNPKK
jgi:hypothetical protein